MKRLLLTLLALTITCSSIASSILIEGFEYGNHDLSIPTGWHCDDQSWLCGYQDKDHNRIPHSGSWYAFTNADESWMYMPLYFSTQLKYRFSCWTISDGEYDLEFWAGDGAQPGQMTQLLASFSIGTGTYERVTQYIETLSSDYAFLGIHAVAHEGASHLTIDDVDVDMVAKYEFITTPSSADTVLYPGSQATYHFNVQNTGYTPITVIFSPSHEFFNDFRFTVNGTQCTTFQLEPDEVKRVTAEATLLPSVQAGTTCWMDIMLLLDCDCATAMTTLWVNVIAPAGIEEQKTAMAVFPNPAHDHINISAKGLKLVEISDLYGKTIISQALECDELLLDISQLKPGIYFVATTSGQGFTTQKIVKQ